MALIFTVQPTHVPFTYSRSRFPIDVSFLPSMMQDKRHKEIIRKSKETNGVAHSSLAPSRRNREDHSSQKSERTCRTKVSHRYQRGAKVLNQAT
ncbi:hypothetical protein L6452_09522 [Arctium lappa]|uniref:Uncharacterized protein n=1 Tax=Arctium lappa TaxID=4217 RepID=A0ACB9DKL8_ARCLA|nr:hypothetical protein L6452_09522 [Arctium lappa]